MTNEKRKLIFCWPYVEWGGAQIYFMAIMKVAKPDWDVVAIFPADSPPDVRAFLDEIGVRYETLDFRLRLTPARGIVEKLRRQANRIGVELALLKYLKRYDLANSILQIETSPWQSWIFLTLLSLRGANVFVTMHNAVTGSAWRQAIWKLRMRFVTRLRGFNLFVSNQDTKNRIRDWSNESFWQRIPVTYTCVDPKQIMTVLETPLDRAAIRHKYGIQDSETLVLCVGQFIDRKGRWVFVEAAKRIEDRNPNIKFIWLTPQMPSDEETVRLEAYCANNLQLILSSEVGTSREQVLSFFRIADIFALPSFVEGLPIALLEAMSLGIPAISTNVYAIPEAVKQEETGLLIEAGDADALAESIERLASNRTLRDSLARNGSDFVLGHFDERVAAARAIEAYNRCFADASTAAN